MPAKKIARLTELGRRKAALTDQLAKVHAEECQIMNELLADHGPAAGIDAATMTAASQPKTKPE